MAWSYSDYVTYDEGSATAVERLALHVQEVSDLLATGSYTLGDHSFSAADLQRYLADLKTELRRQRSLADAGQGKRIDYSRGVPSEDY